jgi:small subunit ribosomal protein S5
VNANAADATGAPGKSVIANSSTSSSTSTVWRRSLRAASVSASPVVIGDQKGRVGFGHGKAREVPEAIRKATDSAKRNLTRVALREGRTLHHDIAGRHGAGRVYLRAAPAGTGIIAGGPMRAVFETLGIQDVVAKSVGSSNPYNMVRATFDALKHQDSPRSVAARRNLKVSTLQSRRVGTDAEVVAE